MLFADRFIESFSSPPKELVLDFDPTDDPTYGHQEKHHYHGYYKTYCFLPLYVFCGSQLLVSYLLPIDIDGEKNARVYEKKTCVKNITMFSVRTNGDVSMCVSYDKVFGNIRKTSLDEILVPMNKKILESYRDGCSCSVTFSGCEDE